MFSSLSASLSPSPRFRMQNDMGHRPVDLASAAGHVGVAQLLRLHDAALCLSSETLEANEELDSLRSDYTELKSYFRFVIHFSESFLAIHALRSQQGRAGDW